MGLGPCESGWGRGMRVTTRLGREGPRAPRDSLIGTWRLGGGGVGNLSKVPGELCPWGWGRRLCPTPVTGSTCPLCPPGACVQGHRASCSATQGSNGPLRHRGGDPVGPSCPRPAPSLCTPAVCNPAPRPKGTLWSGTVGGMPGDQGHPSECSQVSARFPWGNVAGQGAPPGLWGCSLDPAWFLFPGLVPCLQGSLEKWFPSFGCGLPFRS